MSSLFSYRGSSKALYVFINALTIGHNKFVEFAKQVDLRALAQLLEALQYYHVLVLRV